MNNKLKSLIFDFFQIVSIIYILSTGSLFSSNFVLLQLVAFLILLDAVWEMRRTKFYRVPDTGKQIELVQTGIYKYVRNPMYLAQLFYFGVLIVDSFTIFRFIVFAVFLINFILKIQYEEILLSRYFKKFELYKKTSWRLVPFIY